MPRFFRPFLFGSLCGWGSYLTYTNLRTDFSGLQLDQRDSIDNYIKNNGLQISPSLYVYKLYEMFEQRLYYRGLVQELDGYNFHEVYMKPNGSQDSDVKRIAYIFSVKQALCGHKGVLHGGISATIVDQISALVGVYTAKNPVATSKVSIRYKKPVFKDQLYIYEANLEKRQGRDISIRGTITNLQSGEVALEADIKFKTVRWNKFAKFTLGLVLGEDKSEENVKVSLPSQSLQEQKS